MSNRSRGSATPAHNAAGNSQARPTELLPPFAALRAFDAVGRLGGMRRAAAALLVDHTVISRHIRTLEQWMGVTLIERSDGKARLTESGRRYHARVAPAIAELTAATEDLRRVGPVDRIRIWTVPGFGFQWLAPQLAAFRAAYPQCQLEFRPTDDPADFSRDAADVDIRYRLDDEPPRPLPKYMRQVEFCRPPVIAVASPQLAAKLPKITSPADLLNVPLIHEGDDVQWRAWFRMHGVDAPTPLPGPRMWHAHIMIEAARNGEGVVPANSFLVRDDLVSGRLVLLGPKVTPGFPKVVGGYYLSARERDWNFGAVRRFRHWLLKAAASHQAVM